MFFILVANIIFAQNDSLNNSIGDPIIDSEYNLNFEDTVGLDDIMMYKTQLQAQKLYKNIFLISFVFMLVFIGFLFFIYYSKIKEVLKIISIQEKELILKNFEVKKLGMILNNTEDSVSITNKEGNIIWNNNSFFNVFGYSLEEVEQNDKFNVFLSQKKEIQDLLDKCKINNTSVLFTDKTENKKNEEVWFQRKIMPVIDEDNKETINFVVIDTDFTALQLAMEKNK